MSFNISRRKPNLKQHHSAFLVSTNRWVLSLSAWALTPWVLRGLSNRDENEVGVEHPSNSAFVLQFSPSKRLVCVHWCKCSHQKHFLHQMVFMQMLPRPCRGWRMGRKDERVRAKKGEWRGGRKGVEETACCTPSWSFQNSAPMIVIRRSAAICRSCQFQFTVKHYVLTSRKSAINHSTASFPKDMFENVASHIIEFIEESQFLQLLLLFTFYRS